MRENNSLAEQLSVATTFYNRASEKTLSLRQSLRSCRKCLCERDKQLDVANRVIEKLAGERAVLEGKLSEDQVTIERLQSSIVHAKPRIQTSQKHRRVISDLSERAQSAEASSRASSAVIEKYEREIVMLRAALDVHVKEFQDGSNVHANLVLAVAKVREENAQLTLQMARVQRNVRDLEQQYECLQTENKWLEGQKCSAEAEALRAERSVVEVSKKLETLTDERDQLICELRDQKHLVQNLSSAAGDADSDLSSLQAKIHDLKQALDAVHTTSQAQCHNLDSQWQAQIDERMADLLKVQDALESQLGRMRSHVEETSAELQISVDRLHEEKRAHEADAVRWESQVLAERQHSGDLAAQASNQRSALQCKDTEIRMLHDQVNDLTGVNLKLQQELDESHAATTMVKDELVGSVQNLVIKEHELQLVMKEAENTTEVLRKEYGKSCEQVQTLEAEISNLKGQLLTFVDSSRTSELLQTSQLLNSNRRQDASPARTQIISTFNPSVHHFLDTVDGRKDSILEKTPLLAVSTAAAQSVSIAGSIGQDFTKRPLPVRPECMEAESSILTKRSSRSGTVELYNDSRVSKPISALHPMPDPSSYRALRQPKRLDGVEHSTACNCSQDGDMHAAELHLGNDTVQHFHPQESQRMSRTRQVADFRIGDEMGSPFFDATNRTSHFAVESRRVSDSEVIQADRSGAKVLTVQSACKPNLDLAQEMEQGKDNSHKSVDDIAYAGHVSGHVPSPILQSTQDRSPHADSSASSHQRCDAVDCDIRRGDIVPGEVARWEEQLIRSRERLDVMRMERAQWQTMVQATDTPTRRASNCEPTNMEPGCLPESCRERLHKFTIEAKDGNCSNWQRRQDDMAMPRRVENVHRSPVSPSLFQACSTPVHACAPQLPLHHRHRRLHDSGNTVHRSVVEATGIAKRQCSALVRPSCQPPGSRMEIGSCQIISTGICQAHGKGSARQSVDGEAVRSLPGPQGRSTGLHDFQTASTPPSQSSLSLEHDAYAYTVQIGAGVEIPCTSIAGRAKKEKAGSKVQELRTTPEFCEKSIAGHRGGAAYPSSQVQNSGEPYHSHAGTGESQWTTCIRQSVAGALDEAMVALEAELGYRPPSGTSHEDTLQRQWLTQA